MMYEFHYKRGGLCNLKLLEIQQVVNSGCGIVKDWWINVRLICVVNILALVENSHFLTDKWTSKILLSWSQGYEGISSSITYRWMSKFITGPLRTELWDMSSVINWVDYALRSFLFKPFAVLFTFRNSSCEETIALATSWICAADHLSIAGTYRVGSQLRCNGRADISVSACRWRNHLLLCAFTELSVAKSTCVTAIELWVEMEILLRSSGRLNGKSIPIGFIWAQESSRFKVGWMKESDRYCSC